MEHPEWAGYLAAFQAYIDATAAGNDELARQARRLMSLFAEPILTAEIRPREVTQTQHSWVADMLEIMDRRAA